MRRGIARLLSSLAAARSGNPGKEEEMQGEISLLSAILWAVASGLIGVGIGICVMCLMFVSRRADDNANIFLRGKGK